MSRLDGEAKSTVPPDDSLNPGDSTKAQPPDAGSGGADPAAKPPPTHEANVEEAQTEEDDEDLKAPLELLIGFLRAVTDGNLQLAGKLSRMILIYEPDHPHASEFLTIIHKKLSADREAEQSSEEDEEESSSSSSSSSSCSSSSPSDEEEEEETLRACWLSSADSVTLI